MMYVFIDTSIFEANNFLDNRIKELLKLSEEGQITIVLPEITYYEVINRVRTHVKSYIKILNDARRTTKVFKNLPSKNALYDVPREKECVAEFATVFERVTTLAKCHIIPYPTVSLKPVFDKYFSHKPPFDNPEKKHEFPDAFALQTIEEWCAQTGRKCHILSLDKDMLGYTSPHMVAVPDYQIFLEEVLRNTKEVKINKALEYLNLHEEKVKYIVTNWLLEELDDERKYHRLVDYMDVLDITVMKYEVALTNPRVISVGPIITEVELQAQVAFEVRIVIPDEESSWYDDDDEMRYAGKTFKKIEQTQDVPVIIAVEMESEDAQSEVYDLEVKETNGSKPLVIKDERNHWRRYK